MRYFHGWVYKLNLSIFVLGLIVLLPSFCFRLFFLSGPLFKFFNIFKQDGSQWRKDAIEGSKLIKKLNIPGLNYFFNTQIILGFVPYALMILSMLIFNTLEIMLSQLNQLILGIAVTLLLIWLVVDIFRSLNINNELLKIVDETEKARQSFGGGLIALRYTLSAGALGPSRIATKLGTKVFSKIASEHARSDGEVSHKRTILSMFAQGVESVLSTPDKAFKKLEEIGKDRYDERLINHFQHFAEKENSWKHILTQVLWGIIPASIIILLALFGF